MKTVVPISGGIDSAVVLAQLLKEGDQCVALLFEYGQPHAVELEAAAKIVEFYRVEWQVVELPRTRKVDDVVFAGRNLVFASVAVANAQARGFDRVAFGCNASDWERFNDCRPKFWDGVALASSAYGVAVETPLIHMTKREVVALGRRLGVPIDITWSCYAPFEGAPCGECLACRTRAEALAP